MLKLLPSSGSLSTSKASQKYCNTAASYHLCTVEPPPNKPSKRWSLPLLPVVSSVTSTEWSFQGAVTASITTHVQYNLHLTVPPWGGHCCLYNPCTEEPLLNSPSNGWSPPLLLSMYSRISTECSLQRAVTASITTHVQWNSTVSPMGVTASITMHV